MPKQFSDRHSNGGYKRGSSRHMLIEPLEARLMLSLSEGAFTFLNEQVSFNQNHTFVYQDADSGFNHGFPSGWFASQGLNVEQVIDITLLASTT